MSKSNWFFYVVGCIEWYVVGISYAAKRMFFLTFRSLSAGELNTLSPLLLFIKKYSHGIFLQHYIENHIASLSFWFHYITIPFFKLRVCWYTNKKRCFCFIDFGKLHSNLSWNCSCLQTFGNCYVTIFIRVFFLVFLYSFFVR